MAAQSNAITNWTTERKGRTLVDCNLARQIVWKPARPFDGYYQDDGRKIELKSIGKLFRGSEYFGLTEAQYKSPEQFDLIIASGIRDPQQEVSVISSELLRKIPPDDTTITYWYYYKTVKNLYEQGLIPCQKPNPIP